MARVHLQDELAKTATPVTVETRFGEVRGGRAANGAAAFLGNVGRPIMRIPDAKLARSQRYPTRYHRRGSKIRSLCLPTTATPTRITPTSPNVRFTMVAHGRMSLNAAEDCTQPTNDGQAAGKYLYHCGELPT